MVALVNVYGNSDRGGKVLKEGVEPEWVDYPTAQHFSSMSHTSLWRLVTSGEIKAAPIGRSVRISLPSLREFMEKKAGGQ